MAHPLVLKFAPERPPQAMKQANNVKSKMASMMTCIKGTWEAWEACEAPVPTSPNLHPLEGKGFDGSLVACQVFNDSEIMNVSSVSSPVNMPS